MRQATGSTSGSERTLDATMRAPSTTPPDVVVVEEVDVEVEKKRKVTMNPKMDLWLSTVDGRHQSSIIPVRVGPNAETFYVHRSILLKAEYFRKALDGDFQEAENQAIDLPEEDPGVFSFVVAYLYENSYVPIKPIADVLVVEPEKGKGKENDDDDNSSRSQEATDSESSGTDNSARSRRIRANRRRRQQQIQDDQERNRKEPGRHRPDCGCEACLIETRGPLCWNCGVPRTRQPPQQRPMFWHPNGMPHPPPPPPPHPVVIGRNGLPIVRANDAARRGPPPRVQEFVPEPRMSEEDIRTWIMTYELSIDVYLCAERFLMIDFKSCIAEGIIDGFETAGVQAARPEVLASCKNLHGGTSNNDPILKKVFARVGFLLARLWKSFPEETHNFWMQNPEVGSLIMKETMERRDQDANEDLPAMDRPTMRSSIASDDMRNTW